MAVESEGSQSVDVPPKRSGAGGDDQLPPVQPPSGAFILQLFLIPLVIVGIIVMVWLMFSWLAHMGSDPRDLVRDLRKLNDGSWQKAYTLTNLLRNPEYDYLKEDEELAAELAEVLEGQLQAGGTAESAVRLRMFLARALGEFRVDTGLPVLVEAARFQRTDEDVAVRRAALEAIAILADSLPEERIQTPQVIAVLKDASTSRPAEGPDVAGVNDLRSTAAFALGVVGGSEAQDRLVTMLDDAYPNARYNAAVGLARMGDSQSLEILLEMIDPDNPQVIVGETTEEGQRLKRQDVMLSGIVALRRLTREDPSLDTTDAEQALQQLVDSDADMAVRVPAKETLLALQSSGSNGGSD